MSKDCAKKIEIILGPMFSGKSSELLRRTNRFKAVGKKIFLINHSFDVRTDDYIKTHTNNKEKAVKTEFLLPLLNHPDYLEADVIGIDEAQFFTDLFDFIKIAERHDKFFFIAGLDGNYKREPMGDILRIIPYCDDVIKLKAMDMIDKDGSEAIFTKKIIKDENSLVLIGAEEYYAAVSRKNLLIG